jgi:hypothetical protein
MGIWILQMDILILSVNLHTYSVFTLLLLLRLVKHASHLHIFSKHHLKQDRRIKNTRRTTLTKAIAARNALKKNFATVIFLQQNSE